MKTDKSLTIVVPVYNEEENLPLFLENLIGFIDEQRNINIRAILVNDGSKDNTFNILEQYRHENIQIINHKVNKGYGGALKTGIAASQTEYTITIDADGQHRFEDVLMLYKKAIEEDTDMIVGSRVNKRNQSKLRLLGKSIIRKVAKMLMPMHIYDINSGMKIYNTSLAQQYLKLCPDTMAFSDIITLIFIHNRHYVQETPIRIEQRKGGESTIGINTAFQTLMEIINIVVMFNPLKVFLPISVFLFILGALIGGYFISLGRGLSVAASFLLITSLITFLLGLVAEQLSQIRKNL
jgi:glycosyltransferase involved in cell wall biosynthesis